MTNDWFNSGGILESWRSQGLGSSNTTDHLVVDIWKLSVASDIVTLGLLMVHFVTG